MKMIEEVARAIADQIGPTYDSAYENKQEWIKDRGARGQDVNGPYRADYRDAARAAIEAMRDTIPVVRDRAGVVHELRGSPEDIWQIMLDAALEGE